MSDWMLKAVLSANATGLLSSLKSVNQATKTTRKYLLDVGTAAGKLGNQAGLPLAAISGVFGGFSMVAIKNAVGGFTDLGEAVKKGSLKAGMSVEDYQRMKYVAEQAGVGVDALEGSMGKLNRNLGDAAAGKNRSVAGLLARMGISLRDSNGNVKTAVDLLPQLADGFARNKNPTTQARIGMALFGKTYAELLPLLVEGSAGIKNGIDDFNQIKSPLGENDINNAKSLGDEFKRFDLVVKGFQGTIAKELAPIIEDVTRATIKWWIANKRAVGAEVAKMAKDLSKWIKETDWVGVIKSVQEFGAGLGKLVDWIGGTKNALIGLVIYMNMQTIAAFIGLIASAARLAWGLGSVALSALGATTGLGGYTAAATTATTATAGLNLSLKTLLGRLGLIAAAAAPLVAMWGAKEWAGDPNDTETNIKSGERANWMQQNLVKPTKGMLSWFGFDKDADIEARRNQNRAELGGDAYPSLFGSGPAQPAGGKFTFEFLNAPAGMRLVDAPKNSSGDIDMSTGPNSFSTGMGF